MGVRDYKMTNINKVIVLSMGRTGTTYAGEVLTSNDRIPNKNNLFCLHTFDKEKCQIDQPMKSAHRNNIIDMATELLKEDVHIVIPIREMMMCAWSTYFYLFASSIVDSKKNLLASNIFSWKLGWFDNIVKPLLNVDVYNEPFDKQLGYTIIRKNNLNILIIRTDKLNAKMKEAFYKLSGEVLSTGLDSQPNKRISGSNPIIEFLKNTTMPKDIIDMVYESRFMNHFFTDQEIKTFKEEWV